MIDPDDAAAVWGELAPNSEAEIQRSGLSAQDGAVLISPGLPARVDPLFAATSLQPIGARSQGAVQFGTDFGTRMCVDLSDRNVMSIPETDEMRVRFVNSDLNSFASFLLEVCRARRQFPDLGDDEIDEIINSLESRLRSTDPKAFVDPENWWSVIFEQMREGLL